MVLDLDDVVASVGGFALADPALLEQAGRAFAGLVRSWLDLGADVVAHGPFLGPEEVEALEGAIPSGRWCAGAGNDHGRGRPRLATSPDRPIAGHPELVRALYERYERLAPAMAPSDWTFDTGVLGVDDIVGVLAPVLGAVGPFAP
ncbi:MAG: hypothetical protein R2711_03205 [Acidimicrobiales bacterium]